MDIETAFRLAYLVALVVALLTMFYITIEGPIT